MSEAERSQAELEERFNQPAEDIVFDFDKFDPDQPRAEDGKWTDGGATTATKPSDPPAAPAAPAAPEATPGRRGHLPKMQSTKKRADVLKEEAKGKGVELEDGEAREIIESVEKYSVNPVVSDEHNKRLDRFIELSDKSSAELHYRGVKGKHLAALEKLGVGDEFGQKRPTSYTTSERVGLDFAGGADDYDEDEPGGLIRVVGQVQHGASITHISGVPGEKEVLFRSNTRFRITTIHDMGDWKLFDVTEV